MPDLDLILSGHTHTTLEEPIVHGDTYVVSCGEYGKNLGELSMTQKADGRWEMTSYELVPVTTDVDQIQRHRTPLISLWILWTPTIWHSLAIPKIRC